MARYAVCILLAAAFAIRPAAAADDPFVGAWKLDPTRSQLTDQMKVNSIGSNKYAFDFGGSDERIVVDGTDQPGYAGTTLAVGAVAPDAWKVVRKQDGRIIIRADWRLSKDGSTLQDAFTSIGSDGVATTQHLVYARTTGASGFAGTWERNATMDPFPLDIKPDGTGGLAFSYLGKTKDLSFDGKEHAPVGPNVLAGFAFSAQRLSASELAVTDKLQGAVFDTQEITLSADGKTLTMTIHRPDRHSADILVFVRQ